MTLDAADLILTLAGAAAAAILSAFGWWVRGLVKKVDDNHEAANKRIAAVEQGLAGHKLWAAENYVKHDSLKALRDDLIAHFDRLERNVHAALEGRRDRGGAE